MGGFGLLAGSEMRGLEGWGMTPALLFYSFLYRDEYYKDISGSADDEAAESANTAEVIVAKNRHGSVGNVKMGWIGQFTKFRTLEEDLRDEG